MIKKYFNRLALFKSRKHYNFNFLIYVLLKQASCFRAYFSRFPIADFHFGAFQAICLYYIITNINFRLYQFPVSNFGCLALFTEVKAGLSSLIQPFDITKEVAYCLFSLEAEQYLNSFHFIIDFGILVDFKLFIKIVSNLIFGFQGFHLKTWLLIQQCQNLRSQNFFQSQN